MSSMLVVTCEACTRLTLNCSINSAPISVLLGRLFDRRVSIEYANKVVLYWSEWRRAYMRTNECAVISVKKAGKRESVCV